MTILKWPCIPLKTTSKKKFSLKLQQLTDPLVSYLSVIAQIND